MKNRKLNRLKDYDYSQAGAYFLTICTKDKLDYFGFIENEVINLNNYGKIAENCWLEIPQYYPYVIIDEFVIMPNHVHGIIMIFDDLYRTEQCSVPTSKRNYGLLSKIIKSYKETVTKQIRKRFKDDIFGWQRSFYDHIIRDEKGLNKIREYIYYNPLKWQFDNKIENLSIV